MTNKTALEALKALDRLQYGLYSDGHYGTPISDVLFIKNEIHHLNNQLLTLQSVCNSMQAIEPPLAEDVQDAVIAVQHFSERGHCRCGQPSFVSGVETLIRAAQAQPETVTVEQLSHDIELYELSDAIAEDEIGEYLANKYPNGIRIVKEVK